MIRRRRERERVAAAVMDAHIESTTLIGLGVADRFVVSLDCDMASAHSEGRFVERRPQGST
jgi:hypothetical protein